MLAFCGEEGIGVSSGLVAEIVGDWGISASLDELSPPLARGLEGLKVVAGSVEAISRTSFIPAKTLTRPVMASTLDASCTWLTCRFLMESRISCIKAVWLDGGEEDILKRFGLWWMFKKGSRVK